MHLIMFDIDGTLVDSTGFDADLFVDAAKQELGVQMDESWDAYQHVTDSGILEEVLRGHLTEAERPVAFERVKRRFVRLVQDYIAGLPQGLAPIPGAPEFVRELQSKPDVVVALATGGWRETAEMKLLSAGIEFEDVPFASSSDAVSRTKIMAIAERRAARVGEISRRTYFGDGSWDKEACARMNYQFVAVGNKVEHSRRFEDFQDQASILDALGA